MRGAKCSEPHLQAFDCMLKPGYKRDHSFTTQKAKRVSIYTSIFVHFCMYVHCIYVCMHKLLLSEKPEWFLFCLSALRHCPLLCLRHPLKLVFCLLQSCFGCVRICPSFGALLNSLGVRVESDSVVQTGESAMWTLSYSPFAMNSVSVASKFMIKSIQVSCYI